MPKEKTEKQLCVDDLRHAEYYGMQKTFDELYAKSQAGEQFTDLMKFVLQRENILLAYRNIKANTGSSTAGTDGLTIGHIGRLTPDEVVEKVRYILAGSKHGYRPKPVRRKDIPKPYDSTKTRPLGIPCIWDRLIQQCIKQVMEPICEAKFYNDSYGFRPNRSVEHAIARTYLLLNHSHMHYVIEFDIKGFFDNVNHSKLIRQIWSLGIRDKHLLSKIKRILTAPIKMPDGKIIYPEKGTPQGGIISPLRLMQQPLRGRSIEYADNRISLFCAQWGKCAVTGKEFRSPEEIHCHHKIPKARGGTDKYENLVLVLEPVHRLIHAKEPELIAHYIQSLGLDSGQIAKIDKLRLMMGQEADA